MTEVVKMKPSFKQLKHFHKYFLNESLKRNLLHFPML
jgi:hypothetical protein